MAKQNAVSEDELAGLSEEERAALADGEDDVDTLTELAGNDTDDEDEDDDQDSDNTDDDTGDAGDPAPAKKQDEVDDTPADAGDDDEDDDETQVLYKVEPVENYQEKLDAFAAEKKALREQMNEGDISLDQYEEAKDAIVAQEQALIRQQDRADTFAQQNQQIAGANWQRTQERFFKAEVNDIYAKNKLLMGALDTTVKQLANDPANADKPTRWFLQEADRQVRAAFGQQPTTKAEDKTEKPAKSRKPDLSKIPKTLGGLPAADISETGGDEFSGLENLGGMDLEREIARRTKADPTFEKRYLQG